MAKKITPAAAPKSKVSAAVKATTPPDAVSTPVRNTTIPPKSVVAVAAAPAKKSAPTYEAIAIRAFTIWQSRGGSEHENWMQAERELSSL